MPRRKKDDPNAAPESGAEEITAASEPNGNESLTDDIGPYPDELSDAPVLLEMDVLVTKDISCVIPTTVYAHEVPILQAAHGVDRVQVVAEREVLVPGFNPASELERLRKKYKGKNKDPIAEAYPLGLRDLVAVTGVKSGEFNQRSEALVKVRELPPIRKAA